MDTYGNVRRKLTGFVVGDGTIPPKGAKLFSGDREVGWISSATTSPHQNGIIALGFPLRDFSKAGTTLSIEVEGKRHDATVADLPFYRRA
jgi:aminomethyltransferase